MSAGHLHRSERQTMVLMYVLLWYWLFIYNHSYLLILSILVRQVDFLISVYFNLSSHPEFFSDFPFTFPSLKLFPLFSSIKLINTRLMKTDNDAAVLSFADGIPMEITHHRISLSTDLARCCNINFCLVTQVEAHSAATTYLCPKIKPKIK